jgi:hypothetical protein
MILRHCDATYANFSLLQEVLSGAENMPAMCPDLFERLLTFVDFAVHPPKFAKTQIKSTSSSSRSGQVNNPSNGSLALLLTYYIKYLFNVPTLGY